MPSHQDRLSTATARRLRRRADELAPPLTDADRLRAYRNDPIGFARDVLGILLPKRQAEIVRSVIEARRVSVVSGHKVGKSLALAVLALWFYCSFPGARVVITAVTDRQVNGIIWREIRRLVRQARIPIPGARDIHKQASSGLTNPADLAEIRGYTAREAEAVAGTSGEYILYLVDEASAVSDQIYEAIKGNMAGGGAWLIMISNPTRADGEFYDSHHSKSHMYRTIHIDSRESPNITGECMQLWGRPMGGLAVREWVQECIDDWGEDSPQFGIRVAGRFAVAEDAKIFPLALITEMQDRWHTADADGRLWIGVDPAGPGDAGDESAFVPRRGCKVLRPRTKTGLSAEGHVHEVLDVIAENRQQREPEGIPVVVLDAEGPVGSKVFAAMYAFVTENPRAFELVRVRVSDRAKREPRIYDRERDELYANARAWGRAGGAVPEHSKLQADLHAPEFFSAVNGRIKVTPKRDLRKTLGRSPDVGDAFTLCCWEPLRLRMAEAPAPEQVVSAPRVYDEPADHGLDPYDGLNAWQR